MVVRHLDADRQEAVEPGAGVCVYFDPAEPAKPLCIVGQVFDQLGVTLDAINRVRGDQYGTVNIITRYGGQTLGGVKFTRGAAEVLNSAQRVQDSDGTWGGALAEARLTASVVGDDNNNRL